MCYPRRLEDPAVMTAREHHSFFAKKLIPTHIFQSTDKMFAELTGPKREAFLMFLWNEAAKQAGPPLPHVAIEGNEVKKLEVVGAANANGTEVVVLSMPPALEPNEALFIAVVRRAAGPSVFFYERCRDEAGTGVNPNEAVLAEVRPGGMRVNHGFHEGLDLAAFKRALGAALGMSLEGLERGLPEITMAAFMGAGGPAPASSGKGVPVGGLLATLLAVRAALPLALFVLGRAGLLGAFGPLLGYVYYVTIGLSLAIGILLLMWCYQVHDARRGAAGFSPGMAVGGWLIPVANFFLPPLIVRSAWKATVGAGGGLLVLGWWLCWIVEIGHMMMRSLQLGFVSDPGASVVRAVFQGGSFEVPRVVVDVYMYAGMFAPVLAYGLLWYIVKRVNARV